MATVKVKARKPKGLFLGLSLLSPPTLSRLESLFPGSPFVIHEATPRLFHSPQSSFRNVPWLSGGTTGVQDGKRGSITAHLPFYKHFPSDWQAEWLQRTPQSTQVARNTWDRVWPCVPNCVSSTGLCSPRKRAFSLPNGKEWCHQTLFLQYKIWPERASFSNLMKVWYEGARVLSKDPWLHQLIKTQ